MAGVSGEIMNDIDKEIISILKDLFTSKKNEYVDPDELLRETIVKWSLYIVLMSVVVCVFLELLGKELPGGNNGSISTLLAIASTLLFFYINYKSKKPSLIMYGITWFSLMCTFYFAT